MDDDKAPREEGLSSSVPLPEIHLDAVDENEKEPYLEFLVENEVEVGIDGDVSSQIL